MLKANASHGKRKLNKMLGRGELPTSVVKDHFMKVKSDEVRWHCRWKEKSDGGAKKKRGKSFGRNCDLL